MDPGSKAVALGTPKCRRSLPRVDSVCGLAQGQDEHRGESRRDEVTQRSKCRGWVRQERGGCKLNFGFLLSAGRSLVDWWAAGAVSEREGKVSARRCKMPRGPELRIAQAEKAGVSGS